MRPTSLLPVMLLLFGANAPSFAAPALPPVPRTDDLGDPLPDGAVARLGTLRGRADSTYDVCFAPDGRTIRTISSIRQLFCEWDATNGALLRTRPVARVGKGIEVFAPDLRIYGVAGGKERVRIAETLTGKTVAEKVLPSEGVSSVRAFTADGKRFAVAQGEPPSDGKPRPAGRFVAVWDVADEVPTILKPMPGQIEGVTFSPDGKRVAVSSWADGGGEVACWDVPKARALWRVRHRNAQFAHFRFSPDGKSLAVCLADPKGHRVEMWDAAGGKPRSGWVPPVGANILLRGFSPDGKLLLYEAQGEGLSALDARTGERRYRLPGRGVVGFAPDGKSFVTVEPILRRWSTATGEPLWEDTAARGHQHPVFYLAFDPKGRWLFNLDSEHHLIRWDLRTRKPKPFRKGFDGPMVFAPDGKTLFLVFDETVVGIDPQTGAQRVRFLTEGLFEATWSGRPQAIEVSADGKRVMALLYPYEDALSQGYASVTWDAATGKVFGKPKFTPEMPAVKAPKGCMNFATTPDGKRQVVLYRDRLVVRDVTGEKELLSHPAAPRDGPWNGALAVSADGKLAATAHPLAGVLLWDLTEADAK